MHCISPASIFIFNFHRKKYFDLNIPQLHLKYFQHCRHLLLSRSMRQTDHLETNHRVCTFAKIYFEFSNYNNLLHNNKYMHTHYICHMSNQINKINIYI